MYVTQPRLTLLTHLVIRYQKTGNGRERLFQEMYHRVYWFARTSLNTNEDELSGFCAFFFPKLPTMVEHFTYRGITFDYYIKRSVCFSIKTFIARKQKRRLEQSAVLCSYHESSPEQPGESLAVETPPCRYITRHRKSLEKRILILVAVEAFSIPVSLYPVIAEEVGCSLEYISDVLGTLHSREQRRYQRYLRLTERRDIYYGDLMVVQLKLYAHPPEPEYSELKHREKRLRELLDRSRDRVLKFPKKIPHRVVAEVLGIPKGTVDSAIHYLKKNELNS